ncbi:hypothetical protein ADL21_32150 [Streptomyces albus subsp. albus]|nr:hypothetical protein ADL21_32150 [Streptomyces albus subsp. albus]
MEGGASVKSCRALSAAQAADVLGVELELDELEELLDDFDSLPEDDEELVEDEEDDAGLLLDDEPRLSFR